ncbi:hypothetical protein [Streptosporangium sp. NPDC002607]
MTMHLTRDVLDLLTATGAAPDVDEYDMSQARTSLNRELSGLKRADDTGRTGGPAFTGELVDELPTLGGPPLGGHSPRGAADLDHVPPYLVSEYVPGPDPQNRVDADIRLLHSAGLPRTMTAIGQSPRNVDHLIIGPRQCRTSITEANWRWRHEQTILYI